MNLAMTIALGLALVYLVLVGALLIAAEGQLAGEAMRLLPDLLRLLRRLAADHAVPRAARVQLWLLLGYLASPIDLVPDFVPVLGYADADRRQHRVAIGRAAIRRPGRAPPLARTDDGLAALGRLTGLQLGQTPGIRPTLHDKPT